MENKVYVVKTENAVLQAITTSKTIGIKRLFQSGLNIERYHRYEWIYQLVW